METKDFLKGLGDKCRKRLEEIDARVDEIKKINAESNDEAELKALGDELAELQAEKAEAEAELKEIEAQIEALEPKDPEPKPEDPKPNGEEDPKRNLARNNFLVFEARNGGKHQMTIEERKAKAEAFVKNGEKETIALRATLVSGGTIATPTEVHGIEPTFNQVSSIVDLVQIDNNEGMGSAKYAYEVSLAEAKDQTEGSAVDFSDSVYAYATMTPDSIMVLSQISKQVRRQSPLDYEGKVVDSAEKALRVKVAKFITDKILDSAIIAKPAGLKLSAIDEKTLRKIAFNYGSDETIYGDAWLFLTKADLIAFGDIRGTSTKLPVYEITPDTANPNTGVIKDGGLSVRYCLNPNLTPMASASENDVTMFYGQPKNAVLGLFSDYEVQVSEDFAFNKNMLTIRGDAEIGCVVQKKDGFVCVTKGA